MSDGRQLQLQASSAEGIDFSAFTAVGGHQIGLGLSKARRHEPAGAELPQQAGDTAASPSHALPSLWRNWR